MLQNRAEIQAEIDEEKACNACAAAHVQHVMAEAKAKLIKEKYWMCDACREEEEERERKEELGN